MAAAVVSAKVVKGNTTVSQSGKDTLLKHSTNGLLRPLLPASPQRPSPTFYRVFPVVCWLKLLKNFSVYSSLFIFLVSLLFAAPVAVVVYRKLKVFSLIFELVHMGANDR